MPEQTFTFSITQEMLDQAISDNDSLPIHLMAFREADSRKLLWATDTDLPEGTSFATKTLVTGGAEITVTLPERDLSQYQGAVFIEGYVDEKGDFPAERAPKSE